MAIGDEVTPAQNGAQNGDNQPDDDQLKKAMDELLQQAQNAFKSDEIAKANNQSANQNNLAEQFKSAFGQIPGADMFLDNIFGALNNTKNTSPRNVSLKVAHEKLGADGNVPVSAEIADEYKESIRFANLLLDSEISFEPPKDAKTLILRPVDWIDQTIDTWERITSSISKSTNETLTNALKDQLGGLTEMTDGMPDQIKSIIGFDINGQHGTFPIEGGPDSIVNTLSALNSTQFASSLGHAISHLAKEVFGGTDFGIPVLTPNFALVPQNIEKFAKFSELSLYDTINFIALREAAAVRLFNGVPWLRGHLLAIIERYAEGIHVDMDGIQSDLQDLDFDGINGMDDIRGMLERRGGTVMSVSRDQDDAKSELETVLALIEGWIDFVTFRAGSIQIQTIGKFREVMTRRRLAGSASEQAFSRAIGLKLQPTRCQDALKLWERVFAARGEAGRDAIWKHPDSLPNQNAFDDIEAFLQGAQTTVGSLYKKDDIKIEHDWDALL